MNCRFNAIYTLLAAFWAIYSTNLPLKHYGSVYFFVRWQNNFGKIKLFIVFRLYIQKIDVYLYIQKR